MYSIYTPFLFHRSRWNEPNVTGVPLSLQHGLKPETSSEAVVILNKAAAADKARMGSAPLAGPALCLLYLDTSLSPCSQWQPKCSATGGPLSPSHHVLFVWTPLPCLHFMERLASGDWWSALNASVCGCSQARIIRWSSDSLFRLSSTRSSVKDMPLGNSDTIITPLTHWI